MLSEVGFPVGTPSRYGSALDEEMLRLESASQVSSRRSQRSQRSRRSREPPTWDATTVENDPEPSPKDEPSTSSGLPSGSREVQPVCTGNQCFRRQPQGRQMRINLIASVRFWNSAHCCNTHGGKVMIRMTAPRKRSPVCLISVHA